MEVTHGLVTRRRSGHITQQLLSAFLEHQGSRPATFLLPRTAAAVDTIA